MLASGPLRPPAARPFPREVRAVWTAGPPPVADAVQGRGAVGGRRLCRGEGLRGCVFLGGRPTGAECKPWVRRSDARGRGPGRRTARWRPSAPRAQPQSFGSERRLSEEGGGDGAVAEAAASSGRRGERGRELVVLCARSDGRARGSGPRRRGSRPGRPRGVRETSTARPLP